MKRNVYYIAVKNISLYGVFNYGQLYKLRQKYHKTILSNVITWQYSPVAPDLTWNLMISKISTSLPVAPPTDNLFMTPYRRDHLWLT